MKAQEPEIARWILTNWLCAISGCLISWFFHWLFDAEFDLDDTFHRIVFGIIFCNISILLAFASSTCAKAIIYLPSVQNLAHGANFYSQENFNKLLEINHKLEKILNKLEN
jgi:hypothetical protein